MKWSKGSFLWNLNQLFNRNHNWFDYVDTVRGQSNIENQAKWHGYTDEVSEPDSYYDENGSFGDSVSSGLKGVLGSFGDIFENMPELINSLIAHYARTELTGAEKEMNEFNAEEAQKSRDFTEYMTQNKYQMETQSMQSANINPALVYGGGNLVPTASNGAQASGSFGGSGDFFAMLSTMMRMPLEMQKLEQDIAESESREKKNYIEAHGTDLNNRLTEATWDDLITRAKLSNDDLRSSIGLKIEQAETEEEKQRLTAAQTILTNLDYSQREQMFPLLMRAQELTNAYKETENHWQERRYRAELNEISAKIKNLISSAMLNDENRKYAGRMTLGQALGLALQQNGGLGNVVSDIAGQSPLGWLISVLVDALSGDKPADGLGGPTSPTGGSSNSR